MRTLKHDISQGALLLFLGAPLNIADWNATTELNAAACLPTSNSSVSPRAPVLSGSDRGICAALRRIGSIESRSGFAPDDKRDW